MNVEAPKKKNEVLVSLIFKIFFSVSSFGLSDINLKQSSFVEHFLLTDDPEHELTSAKQVHNWYAGYVQCDAQLVCRKEFAEQQDRSLNLADSIISVHHTSHYDEDHRRGKTKTVLENVVS